MATPPAFLAGDYQQALLRASPRGRIWRRDQGSNFAAALGALAPTYERSTAAAIQLLLDASPETTVNLLPEWEASLGLPDPCTVANPSTEQRLAAVRAKWAARGGQSVSYFVGIAAALGFMVTVEQFSPFCAEMPCDGPDYDPSWAFAWQVNASQVTTYYFSADLSSADDPLETYDNTELACRLQQYAPAHTVLILNFS